MRSRSYYPWIAILIAVLGWSSLATAQDSPETRDEALTAIKRRLGPKNNRLAKETIWYVVLLRERTPTRISVTYIKVQGQDATAEQIYEFFAKPPSGYRDFAGRTFPDTVKGRRHAAAFHESEIMAGFKSVLLLSLLR